MSSPEQMVKVRLMIELSEPAPGSPSRR